jgi:hypothetical protein
MVQEISLSPLCNNLRVLCWIELNKSLFFCWKFIEVVV